MGTAGAALLLLRVLVAVNLVWEGTYVAIIGFLIQLVTAFEERGQHGFHIALSILSATVVAALGPGAYSIDARLFGRKVLKVPPRHRP